MQCGGTEKYVSILCNHINTDLFSVCLVLLNNSQSFYNLTNPKVEIVNLHQKRVLFSLFKFKRIVKQWKPDIVLSGANHLNLYLAFFKNSFQKSIKFVARESSIVSINSQRAKLPKIYNWLIKKYYHRFDFILCQSLYMQQDLINNYNISAHKTGVINNPVTESKLETKEFPNDVVKLITVSRLSPEKGIDRLIRAVALLSINFQLHIVGDGEEKYAIQLLIEELLLNDKIVLHGEKVNPFNELEDADLFLMGSYYEGFPNTLLEANAYGIPAIAFNVPGGINEIIINGETGLLVNENTPEAFAITIEEALAIDFNRQNIAATTKRKFNPDIIIPLIEQVFIQIVDPSN